MNGQQYEPIWDTGKPVAAGVVYIEAPCPLQQQPPFGEAMIACNRTEERDAEGRNVVEVEWRGAPSAPVPISLHLIQSCFDLSRFPQEIRAFPWVLRLERVEREKEIGWYRRVEG